MYKNFNVTKINPNTNGIFFPLENYYQKLNEFLSVPRFLYSEYETEKNDREIVGGIIEYNIESNTITIEMHENFNSIDTEEYEVGFLMNVTPVQDIDVLYVINEIIYAALVKKNNQE